MLAASLDYEATLQRIATLAISTDLADVCLFDLLDDRGRPDLVAAAARRRELLETLRTAGRFLRSSAGRPAHPVLRVLTERKPYLANDIGESYLERESSSDAHAAFMRELGYRRKLVVPVTVGNNVFGALTLVRLGDGAPFDGDDVELAEDIGRRAGVAYENARSYARQLRVATLMQEGALPRTLPDIPNMRFDASYLPGGREALVGGDWYDAFPLDDGRVGITVGDVLGKGVGAAVTMGRIRQAMQSAAYIAPQPDAMLYAADRVLALNDPDVYATAVAGIYDPRTCRLEFASGGHAGPFERRADGSIREHTAAGMMLGLSPSSRRELQVISVEPESMLVFFTDGLVEQSRDLDEGYRRLRAALGALSPDEAHPAAKLVESVLDGTLRDDVAVLVLVAGDCGGEATAPRPVPSP